jgi:AraC-like DNA-binding protein
MLQRIAGKHPHGKRPRALTSKPSMILHQFPDNEPSPRHRADVFQYFQRHNVIVHARSEQVMYAEHTAPLSIKTTWRGREVYEVDGATLAVEEDTYLVLNNEQPYASFIEDVQEVESFCLFFRDDLAREVLTTHRVTTERLLDDQQLADAQPEPFFQQLRRRDDLVTPLLTRLRAEVVAGQNEPLWLDERCHELVAALLRLQLVVRAEMDALPAMRQTTRAELYRRLARAKDYLESYYAHPLTLVELAQVACLSPHHFLRLFKHTFQRTPHQYLTKIRLEKAHHLLTKRGCSVTETLLSVGFENASSFARLFRQHYGSAPRQLRCPAK